MNPAFLREQYEQFLYVLHSFAGALRFTRKHRIWEGFMRYGWVARLAILLGIVAGIKFLEVFLKYFNKVEVTNPIQTMGMMGSFFQELISAEYNLLFAGGMKYTLLIFLEILIFHITRRTLNILQLKSDDPTLKSFIRAQVRMIKVSVICYILESVFSSIAKTGLSMFILPGFFSAIVVFLIQCFFTGVTVVDNFNEQFNYTIKESLRQTRKYIGIAVALGMLLQVAFLVPVLGSIFGPFLAAITSALVMYELSDLTKSQEPGLVMAEQDLV